MEGGKYNLIYNYYKCHILFGHLKQGDFLPTIEQIGNTFQVAPQTVRNALMKLQREHLISVSPGRYTIVLHKSTPEETLRFTQNYYLARRDAINEVYCVSGLILMPIFHEGCQRLTDDDLHRILYASKQDNANIASISMFCCYIMMDSIRNRLAQALFFDIVSFFQFPYVPTFSEDTSEDYKRYYQLLLSSCEISDRNGVFQAFAGFQTLTQRTLQDFINHTETSSPLPTQIPFHWQAYRTRPQHCHTLAAKLIHQVIVGNYSERDMLLSYENMSNELGVSVSTVRRTIGLLRNMGFIRSINGVGNQILFCEPNWTKIRRSTIQENIIMAKESVEILYFTSNDVILKEFSFLTDEQIIKLKNILATRKQNPAFESVVLIVEYIMTFHSTPPNIEIFGKLLEFILLVYPFFLNKQKESDESVACFLDMLNHALDVKNEVLFSRGFLGLIKYIQKHLYLIIQLIQP